MDDVEPAAVVEAALVLPLSNRIAIVCTDNERHREFKVASFLGHPGSWRLEEPRYEQTRPDEGIRHVQRRASAATVLHDEGAPRIRYKLTCGLCGLDLTYRRERLFAILDTAMTHGVDVVTL